MGLQNKSMDAPELDWTGFSPVQESTEPPPKVQPSAAPVELTFEPDFQSLTSPITDLTRFEDPVYIPVDNDFEDWKTWSRSRDQTRLSLDEGLAMVKTAATEVVKEFAAGIPEGAKMLKDMDFVGLAESAAEAMVRGTADLGILAEKAQVRSMKPGKASEGRMKRNLQGLAQQAAMYGMDPKEAPPMPEPDNMRDALYRAQFNRWRIVRTVERWRELARRGQSNLLQDFYATGGDKVFSLDRINPKVAETGSYVMDPTMAAGAGKVGAKTLTKAAGKTTATAASAATKSAAAVREIGRSLNDFLDSKIGVSVDPRIARLQAVKAAAKVGKEPVDVIRTIGDTVSQMPSQAGVMERLAKNPQAAAPTRKVARALQRLDKPLEATGAVVRGGATGVGLGSGLGYLAEGEEGAYQGAGSGMASGAIGAAAARAVQPSRQLRQQHDIAREGFLQADKGLPLERWEALPQDTQLAIATTRHILGANGDVQVLPGDQFRKATPPQYQGAGAHYDPARKTITLNADHATLKQDLLHELGEAVFESTTSNQTAIRDEIQRLYNTQELGELAKSYARRTIEQEQLNQRQAAKRVVDQKGVDEVRSSVTDAMVEQRVAQMFEAEPDWIMREVFSESFMTRNLDRNLDRIRRGGARAGRMADFLDGPLLRAKATVLRRLGVPVDDLGYAAKDGVNTVFGGPLKDSPELRRITDQYLRDLDRYGAEQLSPKPKEKKIHARDLVDHPAGGFRVRPDGVKENDFSIVQADGKVVRKPVRQVIDELKARAAFVSSTIPDGLLDINDPKLGRKAKLNGREEITGQILPEALKNAESLEFAKPAMEALENAMQSGDTLHAWYQAIGTGANWRESVRRFTGAIPVGRYELKPYEFQVTKDGNLLARALDLDHVRAKVAKWREQGKLSLWGNDATSFLEDIHKYLENHRQGRRGDEGLGGKGNVINAFFEGRNKDVNPAYADYARGGGPSIFKSFRVDRLMSVESTGRTGWFFNWDRVKRNASPVRPENRPSIYYSMEMVPGAKSGMLPGVLRSDYQAKRQFTREMLDAFTDQGQSIIGRAIGWQPLEPESMAFVGPSVYVNSRGQVEFNPSAQLRFPGGRKPTPEDMAKLYGWLHGIYAHQEAVAGYRPIYRRGTNPNALEFNIGRAPMESEVKALFNRFRQSIDVPLSKIGFYASPSGWQLVNYSKVDNLSFVAQIKDAVNGFELEQPGQFSVRPLRVDGFHDMIDESTRPEIARQYGSKILSTLDSQLGPKVDQVIKRWERP